LPSATQRAITMAAIGLASGSCRTAARTRRAATNSATASAASGTGTKDCNGGSAE